jgi:transcription elongation factor Elf1
VLGFSDNFDVIRDREEGAVLVLEKPPSVADNSDVEDYTDFGVNCIPLDKTIDEFLETMKTQKMAGNLRSGSEHAEPKTLEIRVCSDTQENEKIEEASSSVEFDPCISSMEVSEKDLSQNQPSLHDGRIVIDQKQAKNFLDLDSRKMSESEANRLNGNPKKAPENFVILVQQKMGQITKQFRYASGGGKKLASAEKRIWLCDRCGKNLGSKLSLNQHLQTHNPTNEFNCRICGKAFKTSARRYQHEQRHTAPKVRCQTNIASL